MHVARTLGALVLALAPAGCGGASADSADTGPRPLDEVVRALQRGGTVVFLRHAATDRRIEDRPPLLHSCARQRPLTEAGRGQARTIGRAFRTLRIRVGPVLSSAYCRTRETAVLAFRQARTLQILTGSLLETAANERRLDRVRALLGRAPPPGRNSILVGHVSTLEPIAGFELAEGELAVFEPLGGRRFRLIGRVPPVAWPEIVKRWGR